MAKKRSNLPSDRIKDLLAGLGAALAQENYNRLIQLMVRIGDELIQANYSDADIQGMANQDSNYIHVLNSHEFNQNLIAFRAFQVAYQEKQRKARLLEKTKTRLDKAFAAVDAIREKGKLSLPEKDSEKAQTQYRKAANALYNYDTPKQRALRWAGRFVGAFFALGIALMVGAVIAAGIPMLGITGLTALVLAPIVMAFVFASNWKTGLVVPAVFIDLFTGDSPFQRIVEYYDLKKRAFTSLSRTKKGILIVGSLFGVISAGVVSWFAYASILSIPKLAALGFLGGASAVFPPLAIFLAVIIGITITALFIRSISQLLQNKNLFTWFNKFFDPELTGKSEKRCKIEKRIALVLFFGLGGFALAGMAMLLYVGVVAIVKSIGAIGYAMFGVALLPRLCVTLDGTMKAIAYLADKLYNFGSAIGRLFSKDKSPVDQAENTMKEGRLSTFKRFAISFGNGVGSALLVVLTAVKLIAKFAFTAIVGAWWNSFCSAFLMNKTDNLKPEDGLEDTMWDEDAANAERSASPVSSESSKESEPSEGSVNDAAVIGDYGSPIGLPVHDGQRSTLVQAELEAKKEPTAGETTTPPGAMFAMDAEV